MSPAARACAAVLTAALAAGCAEALDDAADRSGAPPEAPDYSPPRTEWGEPDLRGSWPIGHLGFTPFQRPPEFGDRQYLTDEEFEGRIGLLTALDARYDAEDSTDTMGMGHWSEAGREPNRLTSLLIDPPDGQLPPLTEEGLRRSAEMRSSWQDIDWDWVTDFDTWDRCITRGFPGSMFPFMYNNGIRIFQAPGVVVMQLEMVHEARIIPTDGRAPSGIEHWLGESRGHWDGDTLVIETTNLKFGPTAVNGAGVIGAPPENNLPVGPDSRVVERLRPTGPDSIEYSVTFEDPVLYTAPWTARLPWRRDESYQIFEYACHEANYMIRDYINADRARRAAEAEAEAGG